MEQRMDSRGHDGQVANGRHLVNREMQKSVLLRELTWQEIEPLAGPETVVILPTAAVEQHGRHLPLEVDARIVEEVSRRAAERVTDRVPVLVTPVVWSGVSGYHMSFAGTLTLSMNTFIRVVEELGESLVHHGFRRILILNSHGGNHDPIKIAARNIADRTGVAVAAASYWNMAADDLADIQDVEVDAVPGHACGFETAMMMALRPEMVRHDAMRAGTPDASSKGAYFTKRLRREPLVHLPQQAGVVSSHGWAADPTKGTPENGKRYLELVVNRLADFLEQFAVRDPIPATHAYQFSPRPTLAESSASSTATPGAD
jgi:creatinine amidohydrolase